MKSNFDQDGKPKHLIQKTAKEQLTSKRDQTTSNGNGSQGKT